jgi:hypothetical protein
VKTYLLSLPERLVRSTLGLGAGAAREVGEVVLPDAVRGSQLYKNLVDTTLRFVIEQVGGVEGVYGKEDALQENFLARRTAGNAVEILGIVAFRASPVWVLAALADVCGAGRQIIPEIADSLKEQGLLDKEAQVISVDQMLSGLERTASRVASTINTPPLDIAGLRQEWDAIRAEARTISPGMLPTREGIGDMWGQLKTESARQNRSVFATSSLVAVSAVRAGVVRTGEMAGVALLEHYGRTLAEMRHTGYATFAARQFGPYVRAAVSQFSPKRRTLTDRMLDKFRHVRSPANRSR